jgi:hypothetical protein
MRAAGPNAARARTWGFCQGRVSAGGRDRRISRPVPAALPRGCRRCWGSCRPRRPRRPDGPRRPRQPVQLHGRAAPSAPLAVLEPERHGPLLITGQHACEGLDDPVPRLAATGLKDGGARAVGPARAQRRVRCQRRQLLVGGGVAVAQQGVDGALAAEDEQQPGGEPEGRLPLPLTRGGGTQRGGGGATPGRAASASVVPRPPRVTARRWPSARGPAALGAPYRRRTPRQRS